MSAIRLLFTRCVFACPQVADCDVAPRPFCAFVQTAIRELRHRNMDMLMSLLKTFETDVFTRWRDAHRTVLESQEFQTDPHLSKMDVADMLIVFDEHMKTVEKEAVDAKQKSKQSRIRAERKAREGFVVSRDVRWSVLFSDQPLMVWWLILSRRSFTSCAPKA